MTGPSVVSRYVLVHKLGSEHGARAHALATEASGYQRTPCGLEADARLVFADVLNLAGRLPLCRRCFPGIRP